MLDQVHKVESHPALDEAMCPHFYCVQIITVNMIP